MLINHNINNLSGGVSQQPEESRFDNQVELMENCQVTVAQGLRRRNPLEFVNTTAQNHNSDMITHAYDRGDGQEKYGMILDSTGLRVFDDNGVEKTVNVIGTNPLTSWAGTTDWSKNVQFLTVGDTTWILNKTVITAMKPDLSSLGTSNIYFVWIKRSFDDGQGKGYTYYLRSDDPAYKGTATSSSTTGDLFDNTKSFPSTLSGLTLHNITQSWNAVITSSGNNAIYTDANSNTFNVGDQYEIVAQVNKIDSDMAAKELAKLVNKVADPHYSAKAIGSVCAVTHTNGYQMNISDSWGDQATFGWKGSVSKLADLPSKMDGFTTAEVGVIAITGTDKDEFTNYYIKWEDNTWKETLAPEIEYMIDESTMLAKVVRQSDGTFVFGFNYINESYDGFETTWDERKTGDDDSNPVPSFIGHSISNMFFFKNRLGFTSEENVVLSETGAYYNFFATTVMNILDSDPIDAAIDSNTVSLIRNVNATAGAVTLWTDSGQFVLAGGEILSPATTRISQSSSYACDNSIKPIVIDNEILFFNKKDGYADVLSYSPATLNTDKSTGESIAAHIPRYIPSTVTDVTAATTYNMVFLRDTADSYSLYVYSYYIRSNERIVSAWYKWTFDIEIKAINMLSNTLYIMGSTNGIYKMNLQPREVTDTFLDYGSSTYISSVVLSKFNIQTSQNTQNIRDKFYVKNIITNTSGDVDLTIQNVERGTVKQINSKFLNRKLFIGGNSDKIKIGFTSNYDTGFEIDTLSLEGNIAPKSRNL